MTKHYPIQYDVRSLTPSVSNLGMSSLEQAVMYAEDIADCGNHQSALYGNGYCWGILSKTTGMFEWLLNIDPDMLPNWRFEAREAKSGEMDSFLGELDKCLNA